MDEFLGRSLLWSQLSDFYFLETLDVVQGRWMSFGKFHLQKKPQKIREGFLWIKQPNLGLDLLVDSIYLIIYD